VLTLITILPALILAAVGAVVLLSGRRLSIGRAGSVLCWLALIAAAATLTLARPTVPSDPFVRPAVSAVSFDALSRGTAWMALLLGAMTTFLAAIGSSDKRAARQAVVLLSLAGLLLTCVANDFVLLIVGVPGSVLAICIAQLRDAETDDEWAAAVLGLALNLLGALSLVAGALLVGALAGTTNFGELHALPLHGVDATGHIVTRGPRSLPLAGEIGFVLLLAGLGIPFLAAPFQLGAAEIFEGMSPARLGALAVLPRCAVLVGMIRIFVEGMTRYLSTAQTALTAAALVTLLIAAPLAYWQSSLRRLLALVIMVQTGLILFALAAACSEATRPQAVRWLDLQMPGGAGAAWLLFACDSFAMLGLTAVLGSLETSTGRSDELDDFVRRLRHEPWVAGATVLLLMSLAGVPPLPGFWTRVAMLRSILSVSFPAENDFLPHQNTGYVLFSFVAVAAWLAVAAKCLSVAQALLFSTDPVASDAIEPRLLSVGKSRAGLRIGGAIAALLVVVGFVPSLGLHLAARVTLPKAGAVVAAEKQVQPVKQRHRFKSGDSE